MSHTLSSHTAQPIIHILLRSSTPNPVTPAVRDAPSFDIVGEERLLQDIVDAAVVQREWITCARTQAGRAEARRNAAEQTSVGAELCEMQWHGSRASQVSQPPKNWLTR